MSLENNIEQKRTDDNETIGLKSIIVSYLLHWKLFAGAFVFSLLLGILYLILYPKTYEIVAGVQLQEDKTLNSGAIGMGEAAGLMKSFGLGSVSSGGISLEDELQIFQSNQLLRKMILDLGLNVKYSEPFRFGYRLYNSADFVLKATAETEADLNGDLEFKVSQKGSLIKVKTETESQGKQTFEFASLPAEIVLPEGRFVLSYADPSKTTNLSTVEILYSTATSTAEDLLNDLNVEDYSRTSNIIEFTYRDHDKQRGIDLLNSLIRQYNEQSRDYLTEIMKKSMVYFDNRIDSVVGNLLNIEYRIEKYKDANKLTDIQTDVMFYAEQMKELQVKILEVEAQAYSIGMMSDFVRNPENKHSLVPMLLMLDGGEKNSLVMYNELLLERAQMVKNSSADNPLVAAMSDKADQLRGSVFLSIDNARETIRLTLKDLKDKENAIYQKMGKFPLQEREYIDLRRQQEIFQGVYLILLQKREEAALSADSEFDQARVIEAPYVLKKAVAPRKLFVAIFMFVFTLVIPVGYLFFKELFWGLMIEFRRQRKSKV